MEEKKELFKQVLTCFALISIISTGIFFFMFNGARDHISVVLLMMWTPGISAFITSLIFKDKIRDYGWKPGKIKYLVYGYVLPVVISCIAYGAVWLSGYAEFTAEQVVNYKWAAFIGFELPAPFVIQILSKIIISFPLVCFAVLGEEIGWSGFLTPKLLKITSIPVTSLIIGIFWSVWHYPAIIGGFYGSGTPLWVALPGFTFVLVGYSFIRTVLVLKSESLWTGVILHAGGNTILMGIFWEMTVRKDYTAYLVSETGIVTGIVCLTVSLIFAKLLLKKPSSSDS